MWFLCMQAYLSMAIFVQVHVLEVFLQLLGHESGISFHEFMLVELVKNYVIDPLRFSFYFSYEEFNYPNV